MTHNEICNSLKRWVEFMYDQPDVDKMVITISKQDLSSFTVVYEIMPRGAESEDGHE